MSPVLLLELSPPPVVSSPDVLELSPPPLVSSGLVPPEEPLVVDAGPVEPCPVPDWPPEDVLSISIGGPPVLLLLLPSPSVSESKLTAGLPQAVAVEKVSASKNPVRIRRAYRIFVAPAAGRRKKKNAVVGKTVAGPCIYGCKGRRNMPMTLYHLEFCPFCIDVRQAADKLGIELQLVDVGRDPDARAMLWERRGRGTVPVLGIPEEGGERLMGESRDIIEYLRSLNAV